MKHINLFFVMLVSLLLSCKTSQQATLEYGVSAPVTYKPTQVQQFKFDTITVQQLDSVIAKDKLPKLKKWSKSDMVDVETYKKNTFYTMFDDQTFIIYTLKSINDGKTYVMMKRKIKTGK